jgi:hypothetical protein
LTKIKAPAKAHGKASSTRVDQVVCVQHPATYSKTSKSKETSGHSIRVGEILAELKINPHAMEGIADVANPKSQDELFEKALAFLGIRLNSNWQLNLDLRQCFAAAEDHTRGIAEELVCCAAVKDQPKSPILLTHKKYSNEALRLQRPTNQTRLLQHPDKASVLFA